MACMYLTREAFRTRIELPALVCDAENIANMIKTYALQIQSSTEELKSYDRSELMQYIAE